MVQLSSNRRLIYPPCLNLPVLGAEDEHRQCSYPTMKAIYTFEVFYQLMKHGQVGNFRSLISSSGRY